MQTTHSRSRFWSPGTQFWDHFVALLGVPAPHFASTGALGNPKRTKRWNVPNLEWHLCRQGRPKRAPDMQTTPKDCLNRCHGVRRSKPKVLPKDNSRNPDFGRPYTVLGCFSWVGASCGQQKTEKKQVQTTAVSRSSKKTDKRQKKHGKNRKSEPGGQNSAKAPAPQEHGFI